MFCRYCGTEYQGNFCPKCGASATSDKPIDADASTSSKDDNSRRTCKRFKRFWYWCSTAVLLLIGIYSFYMRHIGCGIVLFLCMVLRTRLFLNRFQDKNKHPLKWIVCIITVLTLLYFGIWNYIAQVNILNIKYSSIATTFSDTSITIDDMFSNYFRSPRWRYYKAQGGEDVVEFTGKCIYEGQQIDVLIQFLIDAYGDGEMSLLTFDGIAQSPDAESRFLIDINNSYFNN